MKSALQKISAGLNITLEKGGDMKKIVTLIIFIIITVVVNNFSMANDQLSMQIPKKSLGSTLHICDFEADHMLNSHKLASFSNGTCYYLYPHTLNVTLGSTSPVSLVVKDESGNIVEGDITFYVYPHPEYGPLISVSPDGYVSAPRVEASDERGGRVSASINGQDVLGASIVRVLSKDYGIPYSEIRGDNVSLYYPTNITTDNYDVNLAQPVS